jgi:hypothetical protein
MFGNSGVELPSMGDIPDNEQRWDDLARAKGYRCDECHQLIPFGERELYFERGLCSFCAHMSDKDD